MSSKSGKGRTRGSVSTNDEKRKSVSAAEKAATEAAMAESIAESADAQQSLLKPSVPIDPLPTETEEEVTAQREAYFTEEMKRRNEELDNVAAEIEAAYAAAREGAAVEPRPLTAQLVGASLSGLAHNTNGRLVYSVATLSSLALTEVTALGQFRHLQKVLLDNNQLTSVAALSTCDALVHLSVRGNQLTEAVFEELKETADTLQFLDVSQNAIASLEGAERLPFLNALLAEGNKITRVRASGDLAKLKSLWKVLLADNDIDTIEPGAFAHCPLRIVDLSRNKLSSIENVLPLAPTLTVLGLEGNTLMHMHDVTQFHELTTVTLAGNNLYDMGEVHQLATLPRLRNLSLIGNPLCSFGALPGEPVDADTRSDIVCQDDGDESVSDTHNGATSRRPSNMIPTSSQAGGVADAAKPHRVVPTANTAKALREGKNAPFEANRPDRVDQEELAALGEEQQYRLHVIWRVPQLSHLDGTEVTPAEATDASNLVGGVDRESRIAAQDLLHARSGARSGVNSVGGPIAGSAIRVARARITA